LRMQTAVFASLERIISFEEASDFVSIKNAITKFLIERTTALVVPSSSKFLDEVKIQVAIWVAVAKLLFRSLKPCLGSTSKRRKSPCAKSIRELSPTKSSRGQGLPVTLGSLYETSWKVLRVG